MRAEVWLSAFRVGSTGREDRPAGVYGAAFLDYGAGSVLTYRELLVARLLDAPRRTMRITDIWVDSEVSRDGGRTLWAIPKDLAQFWLHDRARGPVSSTSLSAAVGGRPIASAQFRALSGAALLRTPYAARTSQLRQDGTEVLTSMSGSTRTAPARATWSFDDEGPLAFLAGRRPLITLRLTDVRLTFGS